jgi:hypothetical protein
MAMRDASTDDWYLWTLLAHDGIETQSVVPIVAPVPGNA